MDRITETLLNEFCSENELGGISTSEQFEHFANWCIVTKDYQESFELDDVHVGGDNNPGIDGVAVLVNGALVTSPEEVDDLLNINKSIDVSVIFIQSKTSNSFSMAEIGSFAESVRDFFREQPRQIRGQSLQNKVDLVTHIYRYSGKMKANPRCSCYYVTTGTWTKDVNLKGRVDQGKKDLEDLELFSKVEFDSLGASQIQSLYRQAKDTIDAEIDFQNKVVLPSIPGIHQAFIGVLPASELFRLTVDDSGNLRRSVFEDNIRDYQGDTDVNEAIRATLAENRRSEAFVVLNNGITIVCRHLKMTGNRCSMSGFQIVNGCQTSNVLFHCRNTYTSADVLIPVKLVHTDDEEIVNAIIRSTNSQNAVRPEELEAMTEFQKTLEQYYRTRVGPGALFYERRSRQYASSKIEKSRIITIPMQIKAFASVFLGVPHRVSGYYGTVRERVKDKIFHKTHLPVSYYTSALALWRLEGLWRSRLLGTQWKPLKWHLIMLFAQSQAGSPPPAQSRDCERYCESLIRILSDVTQSRAAFEDIVEKISNRGVPDVTKDSLKSQSLRDDLLDIFRPPTARADA